MQNEFKQHGKSWNNFAGCPIQGNADLGRRKRCEDATKIQRLNLQRM